MSLADLNRDDHLDIILADQSNNNTVQWFPGDGTGQFATAISLAGPPNIINPFFPLAGDLNGDALQDICYGTGVHSMAVQVAKEDTTFSNIYFFESASSANPDVVSDMDGDGRLDVVCLGDVKFFAIFQNLAGAPDHVSVFGSGTPARLGFLGLSVNKEPKVDTPDFTFTCTNAPSSALGALLIGDAALFQGADPFGIGVLLHVDLLNSTTILGLDMTSNPQNYGDLPVPIPNDPGFAGLTIYAQCLFFDPTFNHPPFQLVSSRGVLLIISN